MSQRQSSRYSAGKGRRLKSFVSRKKSPIFLPNNRGIMSQDQVVQCKICLKDFVVRAGISSKAVLSGHAGWCAEKLKQINPENRSRHTPSTAGGKRLYDDTGPTTSFRKTTKHQVCRLFCFTVLLRLCIPLLRRCLL